MYILQFVNTDTKDILLEELYDDQDIVFDIIGALEIGEVDLSVIDEEGSKFECLIESHKFGWQAGTMEYKFYFKVNQINNTEDQVD